MVFKKGETTNPEGKGGFGDNPQNKANGRWSKETSISYWQNYLIRLSIDDFNKFKPETIAAEIAYNSVKNSKQELPERKELQDRTEGKPQIYQDITTDGEKISNPTSFRVIIEHDKSTD